MSRVELEEVVRRGSPEVQARRTAREDWEAGTWPRWIRYDWEGLFGAAWGRIYREVLEACQVVDPDKAARDLAAYAAAGK